MKKFIKRELYTGKGVLRLSTIPPKGETIKGAKGDFTDWKEGAILLEAANSNGERKYDWNNKVVLSVMPLEVEQLLSVAERAKVAPANTNVEVKMFHDLDKGGPNEGKNVKTLTVQAVDSKKTPGTKSYGFFFGHRKDGVENKVGLYLDHVQFASLQRDLVIAYETIRTVEE